MRWICTDFAAAHRGGKVMPKVAVVMGSRSDWDIVKSVAATLKEWGADTEVRVISAHRTPQAAAEFASLAESRGTEVIICAAGKAAHLAGVVAGHTVLPVIGLPINSSLMDGLDSLLSTVQMPAGVPVACVAVNGALNAALLALQILALKYPAISAKLHKYKNDMAEKTKEDDQSIIREAASL